MLGTAHKICDRLYMSETSLESATVAWLLEDSRLSHQSLCHSIAHVSGITINVNAYQAEIQGLHALLLAIKAICSYYSVTSGLVLVGCDNLSTLHQAQQLQELTPCNSAHADLICTIHWVCQSLTGVTVCFKHVKRHQDTNQLASTLPCFTQLNILANQLAKQALLWILQHHQCQVGLPIGNSWSLHVNNQAVFRPSAPYYLIPWILFGIPVYGHQETVHIPCGLPSDQLPYPVQIHEICFSLILTIVF